MASHPALQTPILTPTANSLVNQVDAAINGKHVAIAKLTDVAGDFATNAAISALILVVTLWLATWASRLARATFNRIPSGHRDETLGGFIASLVKYIVVMLGGIAILNRLGFQTTSIITVLGAASLAVGLALQGALSNVAAGVMILMFRPYRVGDYVGLASKFGTVKRLDLFNTELVDPDGLKVIVPNGKGFGDVVTNYTDIPRRRIQIKVGIDYDDSIQQAIDIVLKIATEDGRVLTDPAPWCMCTELADSWVTIELRCWAHGPEYWNTYFDILRGIKEGFDAAGITIPYPTQTGVAKDAKAQDNAPGPAPVRTVSTGADPRAPSELAPPAQPHQNSAEPRLA
jgi:small conductance mechanosensitive channel